MMIKLEETIVDHKPNMVMVPGDTNSTLAGVLVAAKLRAPVAHVEAEREAMICECQRK